MDARLTDRGVSPIATSTVEIITREKNTEIVYKVTNFYDKDSDGAVAWDSCGIDWGLDDDPILSSKDAGAQSFADFDSPFVWSGA